MWAALAVGLTGQLVLLEPATAFHGMPLGFHAAQTVTCLHAPSRLIARAGTCRSLTAQPAEGQRSRKCLTTLLHAEERDSGEASKSMPEDEASAANLANLEQKQIQDLRVELAGDASIQDSASTKADNMTFEEWKRVFGDVIDPGLLKKLFDQLDSDKNGKVSMREFINGLDGFHGGRVHPAAVKVSLDSDAKNVA